MFSCLVNNFSSSSQYLTIRIRKKAYPKSMNGGISMKELIETCLQGKLMTLLCMLLTVPFLIMMVSITRRFQPMLIEEDGQWDD